MLLQHCYCYTVALLHCCAATLLQRYNTGTRVLVQFDAELEGGGGVPPADWELVLAAVLPKGLTTGELDCKVKWTRRKEV